MVDQVLVTGVAGGVGGGIVRAFAAAGWEVIGTDLEAPDEELPLAQFIACDLADEDQIAVLYAGLCGVLEDTLPEVVPGAAARTRCIVNNAAVQVVAPIQETEPADWDRVMAVNVRAPYLSMRLGLPWLQEAEHRSIVNISSVHAHATSPSIAAYAASKGALTALTRAAALDLAAHQVRVNAILPGAIDTPMLRASVRRAGEGDDVFERFAEGQVLGRVGTPDEVGRLALFLADPDTGGFFTGANVVMDGGATIRLSTE